MVKSLPLSSATTSSYSLTHAKANADNVTYSLPSSKLANTDITRLINSTEIQSIVRPAGPKKTKRPFAQKKNPLKNSAVM